LYTLTWEDGIEITHQQVALATLDGYLPQQFLHLSAVLAFSPPALAQRRRKMGQKHGA
jgi:hypothetical protein